MKNLSSLNPYSNGITSLMGKKVKGRSISPAVLILILMELLL